MLDKTLIGWASSASTVEVEKGRLRFFARVIEETTPVYHNEEAAQAAHYRSLPIPPTFLFCLEMEESGLLKILNILNIDIMRILHGEQSFTYYHPVCAGDRITFQSTISDIYAKKGGELEFLVQDTSARNQDDVLVGEMRSVIIVRNEERFSDKERLRYG